MNYKAIIFDFDGVVFDSEKIHLQACNHVFQPLGFTIPENEYFQHYVGVSDSEMFDIILDKKNISYTADQSKSLQKDKILAFQTIINQNDSLVGVGNIKQFLETTSKIIHNFAICSGAWRDEIDTILNKIECGNLKQYFKFITSIDDINIGKPSPEGYLLTAQRLNVTPKDCLAIEDTPVGIAAAKNAGMSVIGITSTQDRSALGEADFIANNYDEINEWLLLMG